MDVPCISKYIPAGCLSVSVSMSTREIIKASGSSTLPDWKFFVSHGDFPEPACLPAEVQNALLESPALKPCVRLWNNRWIQMAFNHFPSSAKNARLRVYILPQDVDRSIVGPREELTKATALLMSQLNFSSSYWNGGYPINHQSHPSPSNQEDLANGNDTSLLSMFNNVPSPDPHAELESNLDTRDRMECLLESEIPGLITKLYPYQGRSAALMLQREENPGRIVDPRFQSVLDQEGKPWYYDSISGLVLREPRYYDGVRGGILAEEMGVGKTLICLALVLSTKDEPSIVPERFVAEVPPRLREASFMDMIAAATNKHSIPWKLYFNVWKQRNRHYEHCIQALSRPENRAHYKIENDLVEPRRSGRTTSRVVPAREVYLSCATLVVVPNNLVKQWQNEISKHTTGLNVLVLVSPKKVIPPVTALLNYDIILFSESRFELIQKERSADQAAGTDTYCPLEYIRFKRCIIDEGHKLGNKSRGWKSDVLIVLDRLEISARWVVTGTPSRGLYGVDQPSSATKSAPKGGVKGREQSTAAQEREDLQRIGNLTTKYLKVRPWANTKNEVGDRVADWSVYVMNPKQHVHGYNRKDCLRTTLNSLIIRHRRSDVSALLPPVKEKIVLLDGSFQDKLSLNLFSMMIIFNSVQSQRTDQDYFFHEKQRKSLIQLVKNLKQACFFGGVFYSVADITKALETAEGFLEKKDIPISDEDEALLKQAISFGKLAVKNRLKAVSNQFHAMPLYVDGFPGNRGRNWSLDEQETDAQPVCTDAGMIHALQKFLNPCIDAPTSLQNMIESGRLDQQGAAERSQALMAAQDASGHVMTQMTDGSALAGNTALGDDRHSRPKSGDLGKAVPSPHEGDQGIDSNPDTHIEIAEPLAKANIISTVSAKLSYLIDSIVKYQDEEQIIVFYDNDNIAYYLAGVLEILQIQHLIYARAGLTANRRAQYVATFTHNPQFRVMLMDISQAAYGLDMRSASRIYFISPVLNPQVEEQAIGRARRISQQKPVSVETLVLRNSIEEVIVNRRKEMTHAEHSKVKSILDDKLIYQWILTPKIIPMSDEEDGVAQTAMLDIPQFVFGRGFGRELHPDDGLTTGSLDAEGNTDSAAMVDGNAPLPKVPRGTKRPHSPSPATSDSQSQNNGVKTYERPSKRVAFAE